MAQKGPNPIDKQVGARVRMRRLMLGISQEKLAAGLHLSFQQIQKYEKGTNRIGASRLQHIAQILQVPVGFFFEDLPTLKATQDSYAYVSDFLASPDGLALVKAFTSIRDRRLRRCIVDLVKAAAR
jgi:transcriptional regulator with XRE-family HTH domain